MRYQVTNNDIGRHHPNHTTPDNPTVALANGDGCHCYWLTLSDVTVEMKNSHWRLIILKLVSQIISYFFKTPTISVCITRILLLKAFGNGEKVYMSGLQDQTITSCLTNGPVVLIRTPWCLHVWYRRMIWRDSP